MTCSPLSCCCWTAAAKLGCCCCSGLCIGCCWDGCGCCCCCVICEAVAPEFAEVAAVPVLELFVNDVTAVGPFASPEGIGAPPRAWDGVAVVDNPELGLELFGFDAITELKGLLTGDETVGGCCCFTIALAIVVVGVDGVAVAVVDDDPDPAAVAAVVGLLLAEAAVALLVPDWDPTWNEMSNHWHWWMDWGQCHWSYFALFTGRFVPPFLRRGNIVLTDRMVVSRRRVRVGNRGACRVGWHCFWGIDWICIMLMASNL